MNNFVTRGLRSGIEKIRNNHQLGYTLLVALVIFASFVFVVIQFTSIARDAQDRLVNVRVGSIHDTFAAFINHTSFSDAEQLSRALTQIAQSNQTIREFVVVAFEENEPIIIAALNPERIGENDTRFNFLYSLARTDTNQSFTVETANEEERLFQTIRAVKGTQDEIVGAIRTTQTLSEADRAINASIRNSLIIFTIIVVVVLLLFFRFAKILDYAVLYTRLKEVDQLKDDFVAMASHELRTPLTVIRGYMEYIRKSEGLNDEEREFARRIDVSTVQLEELVSDILDVSRIEQGRMTFDFEHVDLSDAAKEQAESLRAKAKEKGLTLEFHASEKILICADQGRLRQVLTNIIGNAVKYTKEGSVTVTVAQKGLNAELRVRDTGIGIGAEEQKQLFAKFYRIQNEETKDIRGTGLGLWLTKTIITTMKGEIAVESIEGVGTQFIVTFPRVT